MHFSQLIWLRYFNANSTFSYKCTIRNGDFEQFWRAQNWKPLRSADCRRRKEGLRLPPIALSYEDSVARHGVGAAAGGLTTQ
jgi:hypothetical protein